MAGDSSMNPPVLSNIESDPKLCPYKQDVIDFLNYLDSTAGTRLRLRGLGADSVEVETEIEYIHRWTATYRKSWLAKMYLLDEWYQENRPPVTLMTLTTYQDGWYSRKKGRMMTIPESFNALKIGWDKLSKVLRKPETLGKFEYFWAMEPHETGYPHMHNAVYADVPESLQEKIIDLWESYGVGTSYGIDFSVRESKTDIKSLRNYLMKYLAKGLGKSGSRFGDEPMLPGHLVFHSQVWKHHWRIFGSSRNLSKVMSYHPPEKVIEPVQWLSIDFMTYYGDAHNVWRRKGSGALLDGLFNWPDE
jgi:hypothetical protein